MDCSSCPILPSKTQSNFGRILIIAQERKQDLAVLSGPLLTQCEDAVKEKIKVPKQQRPTRKFSSS